MKNKPSNKTQKPKLFICTGAGISVESGVPTFRDENNGALWNDFDVNEVCNINTFVDNYDKVHAFYNERRKELINVEPNQAHKTIASLEEKFGNRVKVLTTNVDDLHERAGTKNIVHLHGKLTEVAINYGTPDVEIKEVGYNVYDPSLDVGLSKPNVVFFGEVAPEYVELYLMMEYANESDILLIVGTSNQVINYNDVAEQFPGLTYNINPNDNVHGVVDYTTDLRETATVGIQQLLNEITHHMETF